MDNEEGAAHNTALINNKIVVMNISDDLFMSADWGKSWCLGNYFPNEGSCVYETVKVDHLKTRTFRSGNVLLYYQPDKKEFTPPSPSA